MKHVYTKILFIGLLLMGFSNWGFGQNQKYCGFDGSNDYIKYSDDATLGRMDGATDYTIEAWVYPIDGSVAEYDRVLDRYYSFNIQMYDQDNNGKVEDWYFVAIDGSGNKHFFNTQGDATLTLDAWNHIAVICNSTAGTLKLYVNGLDVTQSGGYSDYQLRSSHSSDNLYIGSHGTSASFLGGYLDEVRLKNVAENPANLHFHTYDDEYTSDGNTAALFHFNEGSGTSTANEASSTNATLNGGTSWINWDAHKILPLSKFTWNGGSTDWGTSSNWSMSAVPTTGAYVVIPNVTNDPVIGASTTAVAENITIESSGQLTVSSGGSIEIAGLFTNDGTYTDNGTTKINGSSAQTIPALTYNNLTIDNSNGVTLAGDVTVNGDLTITNGNLTNNNNFTISGSYTNNGTYTDLGTTKFNGSTAQTVPAGSYHNLTINNSSGVTLAGGVGVSGALTLTNGIITSTSTNILTMADGSSVSGGSNTAFVDGPMAKIGSTDFVFPVGNVDTLGQIGISNLSASETFTAQYTKAEASNSSSLTYPLTKVSKVESWQLERAGSETADVTLYWQDSKYSGIGSLSDLRVAHYNSTNSAWEELSGATTTGSASLTSSQSGSITIAGVSSFSPFTFGTTDNTTNTLPVELISFNLSYKDNSINLHWQTASELNNDGFEIQRSEDAESWEKIGFVKGNGNSNTIQNYTFIDNSPKVFNYYRLKQIDFDGAFDYSEVIFSKLSQSLSLKVYPNPVINFINIKQLDINNAKQISLYDASGRHIQDININNLKIDVSNLYSGYYYIVVTQENGSLFTGRFLKE